jgi:hypothetical protein
MLISHIYVCHAASAESAKHLKPKLGRLDPVSYYDMIMFTLQNPQPSMGFQKPTYAMHKIKQSKSSNISTI